MYQLSDNNPAKIMELISNSNDDTVILMSDEYRAVTVDTDKVSFVRSHRAPRNIGMYIFMLGIGSALLGMAIFSIGAVFGITIGH